MLGFHRKKKRPASTAKRKCPAFTEKAAWPSQIPLSGVSTRIGLWRGTFSYYRAESRSRRRRCVSTSERQKADLCVRVGTICICMYACLSLHEHTHIHADRCLDMRTYIRTYVHTYIHACMHACMHAFLDSHLLMDAHDLHRKQACNPRSVSQTLSKPGRSVRKSCRSTNATKRSGKHSFSNTLWFGPQHTYLQEVARHTMHYCTTLCMQVEILNSYQDLHEANKQTGAFQVQQAKAGTLQWH